jgi:hypothetical protein
MKSPARHNHYLCRLKFGSARLQLAGNALGALCATAH